MYKLIFIDLDGTLLNDKKEISTENVKWLNKAFEEKGIISIITTGRQLGFVQNLYNKYQCSFGDCVIASNGATIKDIKTNEYINKKTFSKDEIASLRRIYLKEDLDFFMIYTETESYMERKNKNSKSNHPDDNNFVDNIDILINENQNLNVFICIFGGEEHILNNIIKKYPELNKFENSPVCEYKHTKNNITTIEKYFDVMKKDCNKKNAIKKVIEKFGVNYEEIIVIGDGGNDLPMFNKAGLKIAMGNANSLLKQKADYITSSNNEDGVAEAIKKFIFNIN